MARLKLSGIAIALNVLLALAVYPLQAETAKSAASRFQWTTITVGASGRMNAVLMTPEGPGPFSAIVVLQNSAGEKPEDMGFAKRLAREGYVVLVPYFFDAYGLQGNALQEAFTGKAQAIYSDLAASVDQLRKNAKVDSSKVGAIGFSNGGYFALWLAATGDVQAGVSFYGALTGAGTDNSMSFFRKVFSAGSSPVLILHGEADFTVSVAKASQLDSILTAKGSPHEYHVYSGTAKSMSANSADNPDAGDAWLRTKAFFAKNLKKQNGGQK
jgi:carboxymethylenebutenolidase